MSFVSDWHFREGSLNFNFSIASINSNYSNIFPFPNQVKFDDSNICTKLLIREQKIINCRFSYVESWELLNLFIRTKKFSYHICYEKQSSIEAIFSAFSTTHNRKSNRLVKKIKGPKDTHMEEFMLYWIQYKNSLKYKVGWFWRFSYVYTIN